MYTREILSVNRVERGWQAFCIYSAYVSGSASVCYARGVPHTLTSRERNLCRSIIRYTLKLGV